MEIIVTRKNFIMFLVCFSRFIYVFIYQVKRNEKNEQVCDHSIWWNGLLFSFIIYYRWFDCILYCPILCILSILDNSTLEDFIITAEMDDSNVEVVHVHDKDAYLAEPTVKKFQSMEWVIYITLYYITL